MSVVTTVPPPTGGHPDVHPLVPGSPTRCDLAGVAHGPAPAPRGPTPVARPPDRRWPMSARVVTAHLDDVRTLPSSGPGDPAWKPLRHHLGIGAFGVNAWLAAAPGEVAVERHEETPSAGGA